MVTGARRIVAGSRFSAVLIGLEKFDDLRPRCGAVFELVLARPAQIDEVVLVARREIGQLARNRGCPWSIPRHHGF